MSSQNVKPPSEESAPKVLVDESQLTAAEFVEQIVTIHPKIAVFDCDGTLWQGDAGYDFMLWSIESGLVSRSTADWMDTRYRGYRKGEVSEEAICGDMVQMYAGLSEQELRRAAADFFSKHVEANIFPAMRDLCNRLRALGAELWAVSSTNIWVIEEGVRRFGIPPEHVLGARMGLRNGVITQEVLEVPTGEGKAFSLRRAGVENPDVVFGNSVHDLAMLAMARVAIAIHPSPALLKETRLRGWRVYRPSHREGELKFI